MFTVNRNPTKNDLRQFGRAMLLGFAVLGGLLWLAAWRRSGAPLFAWTGAGGQWLSLAFFASGVLLFAISVTAPAPTRTIYVAWMSATVPVGIAMSTVLLTVLFVLILPVFALIVRLGDPLRLKRRGSSYWEDYKPHEPTLERMRRSF